MCACACVSMQHSCINVTENERHVQTTTRERGDNVMFLTVIPPFPPTLPTPHTVSLLLCFPLHLFNVALPFPPPGPRHCDDIAGGPASLCILHGLDSDRTALILGSLCIQQASMQRCSGSECDCGFCRQIYHTQFMTIVMNRVVMTLVMSVNGVPVCSCGSCVYP